MCNWRVNGDFCSMKQLESILTLLPPGCQNLVYCKVTLQHWICQTRHLFVWLEKVIVSCPRTVTWPVLKHGWSFALTGHHVLYDICMSWETWWLFANVQLVSLLSVWILHFVGLFHNIVHHTICKVCASIVNKAAVPLLCKLIVVFVWLFMMMLLLIF